MAEDLLLLLNDSLSDKARAIDFGHNFGSIVLVSFSFDCQVDFGEGTFSDLLHQFIFLFEIHLNHVLEDAGRDAGHKGGVGEVEGRGVGAISQVEHVLVTCLEVVQVKVVHKAVPFVMVVLLSLVVVQHSIFVLDVPASLETEGFAQLVESELMVMNIQLRGCTLSLFFMPDGPRAME